MTEWCVVPGPASTELGRALAKELGARVLEVELRLFPDGESKVRLLGEVGRGPTILVQSTYPPTDRHMLQLFLTAHKLSEEGAEVYAAIPYLAYARQDKEFLKGEVVSLAVIARLLRCSGVKRVITVDLHSIEGLGHFSIPAYTLSAIPLLAHFLRNLNLQDPIAISPDFGGSSRVEAFAKVLGSEHIAFRKVRDRMSGEVRVEVGADLLRVEGRDVVLVDDIISTGESVAKAAHLLRVRGARRILAACTHPLLVDGALEKLKRAGVEEVIGTNTVPSPVSKIDVMPLYAEHLRSLRGAG